MGLDLSLTGLDAPEIDRLLDSPDISDSGDADECPAVEENPITRAGDIWLLGRHRLMCGDSTTVTDIDALTLQERCNLLLTDPPYGVNIVKGGTVGAASPFKFGTTHREYSKSKAGVTLYQPIIGDDTTETARSMFAIAQKCTDIQVIFGGNYFTDFLPPSRCWFVWDKGMPDGVDFAQCELAWVSNDDSARLFRRLWAGVCREGDKAVEGRKRVHPTQKPVSLFEDILSEFPDAKTVLDLFGGSGSTLIACEKTGRVCRMMELSPHYCDVIVKRWQNFTGRKATLEPDGRDFETVAKARRG